MFYQMFKNWIISGKTDLHKKRNPHLWTFYDILWRSAVISAKRKQTFIAIITNKFNGF